MKLYAWDADRDRRLACIDEPPFDDEGEDLLLFNGMSLDPGVAINIEKPKKGELTDFLYSPTLMMFVSSRAREIIERAHVPNIQVHKVVLRDKSGRVIDDTTYSWINVMPLVELLDRERSIFTERVYGGIKSVSKLVIREDAVPADDLFLFKELNLPIFSERLYRDIDNAGLRGAEFEELDDLTWPT